MLLPDELERGLASLDDPYKAGQLRQVIEATIVKARRNAVNLVLRRLCSDYSVISPPIKTSPMELTTQASDYNLFANDLHKWAVREGERWKEKVPQ